MVWWRLPTAESRSPPRYTALGKGFNGLNSKLVGGRKSHCLRLKSVALTSVEIYYKQPRVFRNSMEPRIPGRGHLYRPLESNLITREHPIRRQKTINSLQWAHPRPLSPVNKSSRRSTNLLGGAAVTGTEPGPPHEYTCSSMP